nr:MAG: Leucine rich repeat variant [Bacteriophage sp.]
MNMEEKEFLRNESVYVRRSAAGNPNTSGAVLAELAKDSDNDVRRSAAGNPNADEPIKYKFIVTKTYVATNGTNHIWYKHNYPNIELFYTCGCFCGSRKALISRFYSTDCYIDPSIRMRILSALDEKFKEVFGR